MSLRTGHSERSEESPFPPELRGYRDASTPLSMTGLPFEHQPSYLAAELFDDYADCRSKDSARAEDWRKGFRDDRIRHA